MHTSCTLDGGYIAMPEGIVLVVFVGSSVRRSVMVSYTGCTVVCLLGCCSGPPFAGDVPRHYCGIWSTVDRVIHNHEAAGSSPAPATPKALR